MTAKKQKYYTVWIGENPGVYDRWEDCLKQVHKYPKAKYVAFNTLSQAKKAFLEPWYNYYGAEKQTLFNDLPYKDLPVGNQPINESICVDAACSGNPGKMEYRGVDMKTGLEIFRKGPFENGTNNIGEFLAIVHALALVKNYEIPIPIYSDSTIAINWVKAQKCRTKLAEEKNNSDLFKIIRRAEKWLSGNDYKNPILKWETKIWGEIPADFGRK